MKLNHAKLQKLITESINDLSRPASYTTEESFVIGEIDGIQVKVTISKDSAYFSDITGSECICLK